eukprot:scaffold6690_cov185-Isochrysis_galbana.AAC.1
MSVCLFLESRHGPRTSPSFVILARGLATYHSDDARGDSVHCRVGGSCSQCHRAAWLRHNQPVGALALA